MSTLKEDAFNSMKWTGVSSTYVSVVQLFNIIVLAFFLTPSEIGTMTALLLIIWFTQSVSDGGLSPAIVHFEENLPKVLNTLFLLNLVFAIVLYGSVILLTNGFATLFDEPAIGTYVSTATLSVLISASGNQFRVILMKELRFDLIARQEIVGISINSAVAITLAYLGFGVWAMVIGHIAGTAAGTVILIFYGLRYWRPGTSFSTKNIGPYFRFGKYQLGERITLFFNSRIDQLLIGTILGTQALGIYTVAHNVVVSPTTRVNQIISTVMFPVFAKLQNDESVLRNGYLKLVKLVTMINTPVMLGIALTAPFFVPLLFKPEWASSIFIIQILSFYALIRSTGSPAGSLQLAKGRSDIGFKWNLSLVFVTIPFIYAGSVIYGLIGIASAQVILHAVLFVPYWILTIRPLIGPPAANYFKSICSAAIPGLIMAAILFILIPFIPIESDWINLVVICIAGILLFLLMAYIFEKKLFIEIRYLFRNNLGRNPVL